MVAKSYRELIVWQKAMELVDLIYGLVKLFPAEERFALGEQLRRASISIPSNIAEGFGRESDRDFAHFLSIALGSVFEVETQIEIAVRQGYITPETSLQVSALSSEVAKILRSLIAKLRTPR